VQLATARMLDPLVGIGDLQTALTQAVTRFKAGKQFGTFFAAVQTSCTNAYQLVC
jgi:hypothetical protein